MSNSLNIGEKIKYVFGALEIAKRNREGRELEIIKSANRMVEQLENELADKDRQLAEITRQRNAYKKALEMAEDELMTVRAEIERLRGVIISQITPEPLVLSSYSATTEPAKDERDKLVEQMRDALVLILEGAIHDFHYVCQHRDNCLCWGCQKTRVKAALAAERGE